MGMSGERQDSSNPKDGEWPEVEKAEKLARGAALKWASGVFYRPDQLESLGQYRIREIQRNSSIQSRIKSTVQSYLEGVSLGLEQLHSARTDVQHVHQTLESVYEELASSADSFQSLRSLQKVSLEHGQLGSVVEALPRLFSVHQRLSETLDLLQRQHLLEAHVGLMDLERLRDDILSQLHHHNLLTSSHLSSIESYFRGLPELNKILAKHLWHIVAHGTSLVSENPSLFVSAVRIIEREEAIDAALLMSQPLGFLPPGRPKGWRQKFFQVVEDSIVSAHFGAASRTDQRVHFPAHLATLQHNILTELCIVKDLMVQCCPPHYDILSVFSATYHRALSNHLHHLLTWDLDKQDIFALLRWVLHVYPSPELMMHPNLLPEVDVSVLGPLLPTEIVDYLEELYLKKVQDSIAEWMRKTLEIEFKEWFSDGEPESDYQGCFQTSLPNIAMKMLDENIRVANFISDTLQQKVWRMALRQMEAFLGSLCEDLVEFSKKHQQEPTASKFYALYLLATLNNSLALSTSLSTLCKDGASSSEPSQMPSSLNAALEKVQKKACRLLLEETLADLQPLLMQLPSRQWLTEPHLMNSICEEIAKHGKSFARTHEPINMCSSHEECPEASALRSFLLDVQHLLSETSHLIMTQYVRALLQKRMVCRNAEERSQMARRMLQDASQLEELFCTLGLMEKAQTLRVIVDLQELISLKDPSTLSLEVLGFVKKYPDISDDHVSQLLDLRGDVSKEIRNTVLEVMAQNPQALPENYDPVFSNILVPAPELSLCLGKAKCA